MDLTCSVPFFTATKETAFPMQAERLQVMRLPKGQEPRRLRRCISSMGPTYTT